ncbi:23S rRNA pseudouridylate synthase B, partial [Acinetobacter baumannii]
YGTVILPRELRTGRWMELDKTDIDNLAKSVELKPRQGTGLFGMAKRRTERMTEKPMAARRGGYLRQQRRDDEKEAPANTGNQRKSTGFNRGFKKF